MGLTHKEYLEKVEMSKVYMSLSKYVCEHDLFQQIEAINPRDYIINIVPITILIFSCDKQLKK